MTKAYVFMFVAIFCEVAGTLLLPSTQNFTKIIPTAIVVKRLPKTRSGKILRGTVRKIADKEEYKMPATIDDPAILDEIKQDLIKNKILQ